MQIQGNTLLVAGGAGGIGLALAELLCRLGNEVIIFGGQPDAMAAAARACPGLQAIALDLADPWSVAGFAESLASTHPGLNLLVNVSIAFPARYLPGLHALLDDDDTERRLEAHRLGIQHLTGTLLPHLRRQAQGAVMNLSAGPVLAPPMAPSMHEVMEGCVQASAMSVRKRWASASVEVIDVGHPTPARARQPALPLADFIAGVAHLLALGLHEDAAVERLRALWPTPRRAARDSWDERIPQAA